MIIKITEVDEFNDYVVIGCRPNSDIWFYIPFGIKKFKRLSDSVGGKVINKVIDLDIEAGTFTLVKNEDFGWDWYIKGEEK